MKKKQNHEENVAGEVLALEVKGLTKIYRKSDGPVITNINFKVRPGEFHGFIGANGAGKTTTIKSLIGAYAKYDGEILIYGTPNGKIAAKKRVGYIPEAANFPKNLSAKRYIAHMASLSGMSFKEANLFAVEKLTDFGLGSLISKDPNKFSSGQKKKVLLAQALVGDPDLIIMDEPAANLDPKARTEFFNTLKELQKKGKSIFISSHILAELDQYIDSVTILDGGRVVFSGSKEQLSDGKPFEYSLLFVNLKDQNKFEKYIGMDESELLIDIQVDFKTKRGYDATMAFISKNKIQMETFNLNKMSLQKAYEKYVKIGGVQDNSQLNMGGENA